MKIAFDHQIFVKQRFGGISRYFVTLAEKFLQMNESVRAIAPLHQNFYLNKGLQDHLYGKYIGKLPPKSITLFLFINKFLARNKIDKWGADILHETYYAPYESFPSEIPLVITVHDMVHEIFPKQTYRAQKVTESKIKKIKEADHVICISENTRKDLHEYVDIAEENVSVIYHGANRMDHFDKSKKYDEINKLSPFILFVGNRAGYKNFTRLLKVFANSNMLKNDFNLIAFGGGYFSTDEKRMINDFNLAENVHHVKGDDTVLHDLYEQAQLFIYPSLYEGFGMPTLEAMSSGCPVAASNTSSIPEVVGNAAVLFNPSEVESIRASIEEIINSSEKRHTLIANGYKQIEKFSWNGCAQKTLDVYKSLL